MNSSNQDQPKQCQEIEALLSGYLDEELTQQDSQRVYLHLKKCQLCKKLFNELKQVKQLVSTMEEPKMSEKELERVMGDVPSQSMASLGWIIIATLVGLSGYATWIFFMDESVAIWFKIVKSVLVLGFSLLLGSVIRQRLIARKTDKYKKVKL